MATSFATQLEAEDERERMIHNTQQRQCDLLEARNEFFKNYIRDNQTDDSQPNPKISSLTTQELFAKIKKNHESLEALREQVESVEVESKNQKWKQVETQNFLKEARTRLSKLEADASNFMTEIGKFDTCIPKLVPDEEVESAKLVRDEIMSKPSFCSFNFSDLKSQLELILKTESETEKTRDLISRREEELAGIRKENAALLKSLEENQLMNAKKQERLDELQRAVNQFERRLALKKEVEAVSLRRKNAIEAQDKLRDEIATKKTLLQHLKDRVHSQKTRNEEKLHSQKEKHLAKMESLEQEKAQLRENVVATQSKIESANRQLRPNTSIDQIRSGVDEKLAAVKEELAQENKELESLKLELSLEMSELEAQQKNIGELLATTKNDLALAEVKRHELVEQRADQNDNAVALESRLITSQTQLREVKESLSQKEKQLADLEAEIKEKQDTAEKMAENVKRLAAVKQAQLLEEEKRDRMDREQKKKQMEVEAREKAVKEKAEREAKEKEMMELEMQKKTLKREKKAEVARLQKAEKDRAMKEDKERTVKEEKERKERERIAKQMEMQKRKKEADEKKKMEAERDKEEKEMKRLLDLERAQKAAMEQQKKEREKTTSIKKDAAETPTVVVVKDKSTKAKEKRIAERTALVVKLKSQNSGKEEIEKTKNSSSQPIIRNDVSVTTQSNSKVPSQQQDQHRAKLHCFDPFDMDDSMLSGDDEDEDMDISLFGSTALGLTHTDTRGSVPTPGPDRMTSYNITDVSIDFFNANLVTSTPLVQKRPAVEKRTSSRKCSNKNKEKPVPVSSRKNPVRKGRNSK